MTSEKSGGDDNGRRLKKKSRRDAERPSHEKNDIRRVIIPNDFIKVKFDAASDHTIEIWKRINLPLTAVNEEDPIERIFASERQSASKKAKFKRTSQILKKAKILRNISHQQSIDAEKYVDKLNVVKNTVARLDGNIFIQKSKIDSFEHMVVLGIMRFEATKNDRDLDTKEVLNEFLGIFLELAKFLSGLKNNTVTKDVIGDLILSQIQCFLRQANVNLLVELDESKCADMKKLMYFSSKDEILYLYNSHIISYIRKVIDDIKASKAGMYAQYLFVEDIAVYWLLYTGKKPGRPSPKKPRVENTIRNFGEFIEALDLGIPIETIRSVLDALNERAYLSALRERGALANVPPSQG